jgi:translation initiation factor 2B subunit (eIF-2B alpha/beta/delta family)
MARDNVTFIFRIDSAKAQQTLKALEAQVRKLGGEAVKTKQNVVSLGTGIDNSGQRAAASAVNFQTATQGRRFA